MAKESGCCEKVYVKNNWHQNGSAWGGVYCLGIIGAAVYFLQLSAGFWQGALAILKSFFWPAYLIYHLFGLLKI